MYCALGLLKRARASSQPHRVWLAINHPTATLVSADRSAAVVYAVGRPPRGVKHTHTHTPAHMTDILVPRLSYGCGSTESLPSQKCV